MTRAPLSAAAKLVTGVVAATLIANGAYSRRQEIITRLSRRSANVMLAHGVGDGSVSFTSAAGWTSRTARLAGTADPATRARISVRLAALPGIAGVEWRDDR